MKTGRIVRVKICGITDAATALAAVEAGADVLGFVFAPSRRRVTPEEARHITRQLPPFVGRVGVFVNALPAEVAAIAAFCGLTAVQLCGDEPPDYHIDIALPVIRALRVGRGRPAPELSGYRADAFLFDTYREGCYGGTGEVFDWSILQGMDCPKPLVLAGGLTAANVREAVRSVRPYAVDVSGGVETGGRKDVYKIQEFIAQAKGVLIYDHDSTR
ncbi:phosphoribosylanthranilate isomerase [Desulfoscipio geothermicus]|uniref:N-(5'-phosphoribosyl)anthranilate isomerase n=1 Tax=Desulfoscipio geothermicus DSM 3669 TaxID=1121426 RepID=A0A1I6CQX0_9FIRM|nr:phosphoribosylanthranilate isomerase [Desulfoscipio geothermicus]SFQ95560.1 phosphoribosylanthranilate isomerase [Desulfoscipio geothermicus DSM 3669]